MNILCIILQKPSTNLVLEKYGKRGQKRSGLGKNRVQNGRLTEDLSNLVHQVSTKLSENMLNMKNKKEVIRISSYFYVNTSDG